MSTLPLIPLDDVVVFPGMNLTLALDAGAEDEVLLVPRKDGEFATVGTIATVHERLELPGGTEATTLEGMRRGIAGAARTDLNGTLRIEVEPHDDPTGRDDDLRSLEREYRAVVEEILDLRNADDRIRAFLRSISEPGRPGRHRRLLPRPEQRAEGRAPRGRSTSRPGSSWPSASSASGWPSSRSAAGSATTSSPAPRSSSASTSCASRWTRSARSSARTTRPSPTSTAPRSRSPGMPDAVREQAERELARLERMGEQLRRVLDAAHLPRVAGLGAVGRALRGEARPGARPRGPRRRPRRPRRRQGADHRVHRRPQAAQRARRRGGGARRRRDPHPDRPPGHRQDLDRRVDRPCNRTRVRPHVARWRPRRGRDPRTPPDLHRRPSRAPRPGAPRRRDDEPGDHARRGRQGRRRLARRPQLRPARGARSRPERLVPRPLPGRRAGPLRGAVHRHRQRGGDDSGAAPRSHGGRRLRRLHDRREGRDRPRLPVAAAARRATGSRTRRSRSATPNCGRSSPSTPARRASATSSASSASSSARPRRRSPAAPPRHPSRSTPRRFARRSGASATSRRRRSAPPSPAWRRGCR